MSLRQAEYAVSFRRSCLTAGRVEGAKAQVLEMAVAVVVAPAAILTLFFVAETIAGLRPTKGPTPLHRQVAATIVIPAHDEALVISATVAALRAEAPDEVNLLVVADNCRDSTAEIAASAGATVLVRDRPNQRGKGHALTFARAHLASAPPAAVIVIDADCRIDRRSLSALIDAALATGRPCQAINLLRPDRSAPPFVQVSNFAFMLRNLVRQRGLLRLTGGVHLTGTGMALSWPLFARARLGASNIVEDLAMGLDFVDAGEPPLLVPNATVWSAAASPRATIGQRERWEGGFLSNALPAGVRQLIAAIRQPSLARLAGALDLCVPPLALLAIVDLAVLAVAGVAALVGAGWWPFAAMAAASAMAAVAVALAWLREGRPYASARAIAQLPLYLIRKMPMYLRLFRQGAPRDWVRTDRDQ